MNPLEAFKDTRPEFRIRWIQLHESVIRADDLYDAERMLSEICLAYVDASKHSVIRLEKVKPE